MKGRQDIESNFEYPSEVARHILGQISCYIIEKGNKVEKIWKKGIFQNLSAFSGRKTNFAKNDNFIFEVQSVF